MKNHSFFSVNRLLIFHYSLFIFHYFIIFAESKRILIMDNPYSCQYAVRQEEVCDREAVERVVELAFRQVAESDHTEHELVGRLRQSRSFVPQLSLVAVDGAGGVIGHVLMTEVSIVSVGCRHVSLALAPVSVLPEWQRKGVGTALIREVHSRASRLGYGSAVVLGHKDYYPRFGYRPASGFGISFPFDAPDDCCMAVELLPGGLDGVHGVVEYDKAFTET